MRWLLLLAAAATLHGQCSYSVPKTLLAEPAGGLTGSVTDTISVTAGLGCFWTAVSNADWLHIQFGQQGSGGGTVGFSVDRNPAPYTRTGTLTVATITVTIVQAAQTCDYTFTPQATDFPVIGGSASFQVKTTCSWTAVASDKWINVPLQSGSMNGTITYSVLANGCLAGRSGSISVATAQFPVTQQGSQDNFTLSSSSAAVPADASDGRVTVTTGAGCPWTAFSDVNWLAITAAPGNGTGDVTFHVAANTGDVRSGNLHIGNLLYTVTQAAPAPPTPVLMKIQNAASYAADAVSPGLIVALIGANMGPAIGIGTQLAPDRASVTKSLGGAQALFDDIPAALTYVSARQVNAVVPYGVAGKDVTSVRVSFQGMQSNAIQIPVQAATPGIFTLDASGLGGGAILNPDLSINEPSNRAPRGSVVAIYCSGGGVTDPASIDAAVTLPPAPVLTLPVAVTIGGVEARITYKGGAPFAVAGVTQVNVEVPASVAPGPAIPVTLRIGDWQSQPGVTMAVK